MTVTQLIRNAILVGGEQADIHIDPDGVIAAVEPAGATEVGASGPTAADAVTDLGGSLLLPAPVEPHAHLDKAYLAEIIENPTGDLVGAVTAMRTHRELLTLEGTIERAERAARAMASNGFVAVRSHADLTVDGGLTSVEALLEVRERVADVIDLQIVGLSGWPITGTAGAEQRALTRDAIDAGIDVVGGCPHLEHLAGDGTLEEATDVVLEFAADAGLPVDLHTDETLDPDVAGLRHLAERVIEGFGQTVTASHCVSLGQQSDSVRRETIGLVAQAGIDVVALPHTNLFLQGRGYAPMPRGLTPVAELVEAGVNVAAGADNLQDPFNPVGRACAFETAGLMIITSHRLPADAWAMVSTSSAQVLARASGIEPGRPADLIAVGTANVREAIATGRAPIHRWRRGRPD